MVVIVGAIAEWVRAGMRRARLEGRQIGRSPLNINREQVVRDRHSGMSLTQVAKKHRVSRATVCRLMNELSAISQKSTGSQLAAWSW
jgi:DNA invertase Pin-like site-specific DNA recombinase